MKNGELTIDMINCVKKFNFIKKDLICPAGHNFIIAPKQRSGEGNVWMYGDTWHSHLYMQFLAVYIYFIMILLL